jgi:hypothetical protein
MRRRPNSPFGRGVFCDGLLAVTEVVLFHRNMYLLLRAKKVGHQMPVNFEKFDVVQTVLSCFLTLFQLTV